MAELFEKFEVNRDPRWKVLARLGADVTGVDAAAANTPPWTIP